MKKPIRNSIKKKRWEDSTGMSLEQCFRTAKIIQLIEKKSREGKETFENLYSLLEREDFILQTVTKINKNKSIGTKKDGFRMEDVRELQNEIKNGKYLPSPVCRVFVPKPGKKKNRPLIGRSLAPTLKDKIVQEMVYEILTAIYEPVFEKRDLDAGFRKGKGVRHTLERIEKKVKNTRWCIEGDIKRAYNNIDHKKMTEILSEKIKDQKLIKLLKNMLKSGVFFSKREEYENTTVGTWLGDIMSPMLFNIYMSKLDEKIREEFFLEKLKEAGKENNRLENRARNLTYERVNIAIGSRTRWRKRIEEKKREAKRTRDFRQWTEEKRDKEARDKSRVKVLLREQKGMKTKEERELSDHTLYARYANVWIVITNGSKKSVEEKKEVIKKFLKEELKLELSEENTKIIDLRRKRARFLGFELFYIRAKKRIAGLSTCGRPRWTTGRLTVGVDMERVLNKLKEKGFMDKKGWGRAKNPWTVKSDYEIVENFNRLVRKIIRYYAQGVKQYQSIDRIRWILDVSCKKTLAKKHDMSSIKIIKKYGEPVTVTIEKERRKKTIKQMGRVESKEYYKMIRRGKMII
jgi:retron-type reverse transcriptase